MKEHLHMDSQLRKSLEGYQPQLPASGQERFVEAASAMQGKNTLGRNIRLTAIIVALNAMVALLWLVPEHKTATVDVQEIRNQQTDSLMPNKQTLNSSATSSISEPGLAAKKHATANQIVSVSADGVPTEVVADVVPQHHAQEKEATSNHFDTPQEAVAAKPQMAEPEEMTENLTVQHRPDTLPGTETTAQQMAKPQEIRHKSHGKRKAHLGFYYMPELLVKVIDNEKLVHNLGLFYQQDLFDGRYVAGLGAGVSLSRGYYQYAADYKSYLGSYQKLDSISFQFDPASFQMESTLHTSEQQVFADSISTTYLRVERRFVYLQLPINLGYNFVRKENYALGIRFSPILSVLLSGKSVDPAFDAGQNQLIQINRITPERVKTNWQLAARLYFGRRLSQDVWFSLEPGFHYYFNSVYQKSDHTNLPYSFSLKASIIF